jgi:molybdopterin-guanine dinucleotide biosynthesis protein A
VTAGAGPELSAVILAGGRAARLGGIDKPGLEVRGRTLLATVVAAASGAGAGRIIVVGPEHPDLAVRFVREDPPGAGPFAALRCGLGQLGDPAGPSGRVAVLAADLPFLRSAHLRALLAATEGDRGAVLVDDEGYPQWLAGCWPERTLAAAAAGYTGSSLRGLMAPLSPAQVVIEPVPGEPPPWLDCDTEADLSRARDWPQAR